MENKDLRENKPIAISEYIFIENIILLLILSPFLFLNINNLHSYIIVIIIIYTTTIFLFRRIYFYSDYLIILYPARFIFRKRKIQYSNIKKIRYIYGKSAYAKPEIQIRFKNTIFFHFYLSLSVKKRKEVLKKLYEVGLNVEIKSDDWEDKRILKDLKKDEKN